MKWKIYKDDSSNFSIYTFQVSNMLANGDLYIPSISNTLAKEGHPLEMENYSKDDPSNFSISYSNMLANGHILDSC